MKHPPHKSSPHAPALPLVISIGFSGARLLSDEAVGRTAEQEAAYEAALTVQLQAILGQMPQLLGLPVDHAKQHFFCGLSQLAIGADQCFTRACAALGIPQRIFLPLPWDAYRMAASSNGTPDFSAEQRLVADELLKSPHIIQQRIICLTDDRRARLKDVNLEIVNVANVVICLKRKGTVAKPGGTQDMIDLAVKRSTPVLELTLSDANGQPQLEQRWLPDGNGGPTLKLADFKAPALPHEIEAMPKLAASGQPPSVKDYAERLKKYGSAQSKKHSTWFKYGALVIIVTHLLATVGAVIAMEMATEQMKDLVKIILGFELAFLAVGFLTHFGLHRSHAVRHWAFCRLVAEVARSVRSIGSRHVYLEYLFTLPLPLSLRATLRTLNVLHLRDTRSLPQQPWEDLRNTYVKTRLIDELENSNHQIPYYRREAAKARKWHNLAQWVFNVCSLGAFAVSLTKLLVKCHCLESLPYEETQSLCGALAVILPVLAVGALSLAGASDLDARTYTFEDMRDFLEQKKEHLEAATSEREFDKLMLETESRLLGETATWFSRRSFTNVA